MKLRAMAVILVALLSQGCASFFGHYDYMLATRKTEPTAYYPGTVTDLGLIGAGLMAPFVAPFKKEADGWMIVAVPFVLVDLPCSFVLDTLFLPGDYFYHRAQNDTFWEDVFRTGIIQQNQARRHLTDLDQKRVVSHLEADKDAASNVVDVIFGLDLCKDFGNIEIALCEQRRLSPAQYRTMYSRPHNTGRYDHTTYIQRGLAGNPSIPMDLLITLASSPDKEVRLAALLNRRLPLEMATSELARLAHSPSLDVQRQLASSAGTPPDVLAEIVNWDNALLERFADMDDAQKKEYHNARTNEDVHIYIRRQGFLQLAVASNTNCPASTLERLARSDSSLVRIAVAKNPSTPQAVLTLLAADTNTVHRVHPDAGVESGNNEIRQQGRLQEAVASNPNCPAPALEQLAFSEHMQVRVAVAKNPATPPTALKRLATDKEASVRDAIPANPKAPAAGKMPR